MSCTWSHLDDFSQGKGSWVQTLGTFTAQGFRTSDFKPSSCWYRGIRIHYSFPIPIRLTKIKIAYTVSRGNAGCNPPSRGSRVFDNVNGVFQNVTFPAQTNFIHSWSGNYLLSYLGIEAMTSSTGSQGSLNGSIVLRSVALEGIDDNPYAYPIITHPDQDDCRQQLRRTLSHGCSAYGDPIRLGNSSLRHHRFRLPFHCRRRLPRNRGSAPQTQIG